MPVPESNLTSVESGDPRGTDAKHPSGSQDEFIYVPDDFKVKEGARLTEQLLVGKPLGVGLQVIVQITTPPFVCCPLLNFKQFLQGGVFLLQDNEGNTDPNQVLKAVFKFGIGGFFGMTNLEREWRVGRQLALLSAPGEALPGFMGTGAGVVTKRGKFRGAQLLSSSCTAHAHKALHRLFRGHKRYSCLVPSCSNDPGAYCRARHHQAHS